MKPVEFFTQYIHKHNFKQNIKNIKNELKGISRIYIMVFFYVYLLFSLFGVVNSFTPECSSCKHFIPDKSSPAFGLCNMFQDTVYHNNEKILIKNLAIHCRNNEDLCGQSGFLYEPIQHEDVKKSFDNYEYVKSICSHEYVDESDLDELERLEKEMMDVFQKMRRHNKKIIHKKFGYIYTLFKKKE